MTSLEHAHRGGLEGDYHAQGGDFQRDKGDAAYLDVARQQEGKSAPEIVR